MDDIDVARIDAGADDHRLLARHDVHQRIARTDDAAGGVDAELDDTALL